MGFDTLFSIMLLGLLALLGLSYGGRVLLKGRARFERVDRQGGSALLGKALMEMGYWGLQPVARLLVAVGVSANLVSATSLVFGLISGVCLAFGHFGSAAVIASVSFLMDALDGMIARVNGTSSDLGKLLDSALDRYVEFFFLAGLAIHYRGVPVLLGLVLLAIQGSFMVSYSTAKADALGVEPPRGNMRRSERAAYLTLGAALSPLTIPWLEVHRDFGIALGHPMVLTVCLVAVLSNVSAVERLYAVGKALRAREEERKRLTSLREDYREGPDEGPLRPEVSRRVKFP